MTPGTHPAQGLIDLVRFRDQADELAEALLPSRARIFGGVSLPLPDVDGPSELVFMRTASWLFVHYFEVGRVSVRFLLRRGGARADTRYGDQHLDVVHALRTRSEHNLDPRSRSDVAILEACSNWFEANCGTRLPRSDEHWRSLSMALIQEARSFLLRLREILGELERDEDRDLVLRQWEDRLRRDWPAHRYHELVATVAADLGRDAIDPVAFFNRHGAAVSNGMKLLRDDCDFDVEARKLVERAILSETVSVLPITGRDIMDAFQIPPGPEVGNLLERARSLYEAQACSAAELVARLVEEHQSLT